MTSLEIIDRIPYELAARLEADPYFVDIPVVVAEEGNVFEEIKRRQAVMTEKCGKRGVAVVIPQVIGDDEYPEVALGPLLLRPAFEVVELVTLNRDPNGTGKSARQVARRIRDVIKPLALPGLLTDMVPEKPCIEPVAAVPEMGTNVVAYRVNFRAFEAEATTPSVAAMPLLSEAAGQLVLATATADAAIWYTLDDSYPAPNYGESQLYSGPLTLAAGTWILRCGAYLAGATDIASAIGRYTVTIS